MYVLFESTLYLKLFSSKILNAKIIYWFSIIRPCLSITKRNPKPKPIKPSPPLSLSQSQSLSYCCILEIRTSSTIYIFTYKTRFKYSADKILQKKSYSSIIKQNLYSEHNVEANCHGSSVWVFTRKCTIPKGISAILHFDCSTTVLSHNFN
jgi:hypothetical protein